MKKWMTGVLMIAIGVTAMAVSQETVSFDERKARQELEIMSGILETTLRFLTDDEKFLAIDGKVVAHEYSWGRDSVSGYYLYDQGAVLEVSMPSSVIRGGKLLPGYSVEIPDAIATRDPEGNLAVSRDKLRELQEKVKERQRKNEERIEALRGRLDQAKDYLIEAIANHGDTLTVVKDTEYVNLLLRSSGSVWGGRDLAVISGSGLAYSGGETEYVTIRKSWIKDYKAGRLTLDQFKSKVVSY